MNYARGARIQLEAADTEENNAITINRIEAAKVLALLDIADAIRNWGDDEDPDDGEEVDPGESQGLASVVSIRPTTEVPDGIRDDRSVTGWAPGHSPRSIFGDLH